MPPLQAVYLGGRGACNTCSAPIVFHLDESDRERRFLRVEMVPPLGHPSHLTLRHGAMGVTAATV